LLCNINPPLLKVLIETKISFSLNHDTNIPIMLQYSMKLDPFIVLSHFKLIMDDETLFNHFCYAASTYLSDFHRNKFLATILGLMSFYQGVSLFYCLSQYNYQAYVKFLTDQNISSSIDAALAEKLELYKCLIEDYLKDKKRQYPKAGDCYIITGDIIRNIVNLISIVIDKKRGVSRRTESVLACYEPFSVDDLKDLKDILEAIKYTIFMGTQSFPLSLVEPAKGTIIQSTAHSCGLCNETREVLDRVTLLHYKFADFFE